MRSAKLPTLKSAATIAILALGLVLIVMGAHGSFTSVTCSRFEPAVLNGTAIPNVGECIGFLGYDYIAGASGIAITTISIVRIATLFHSMRRVSTDGLI